MMRTVKILAVLACVLIFAPLSEARDTDKAKTFRQARVLYENGLYSGAKNAFDAVGDDDYAKAFSILCSIRLKEYGYEDRLRSYEAEGNSSSLTSRMHFFYALNLFEDARYPEAKKEFGRSGYKTLSAKEKVEYDFKAGYCDYSAGYFTDARRSFESVQSAGKSEFLAPARFLMGYMSYTGRDFKKAEKFFRQVKDEARFSGLVSFYLLDCEFNRKNYDYVLENGPSVFESSASERKGRIARILSETFLIRGDKENARKYYDYTVPANMTRSDYFYAGTLLYETGDYSGAVEKYLRMDNRADSLGQIANYNLAGAYMNLRNQVGAMDAFKAASEVEFDSRMTEDAFFNYAKLAFDLNKDTSVFAEYIKRYSTSRRGDLIYSYMALASLYSKDYASAVAAYDKIDELAPEMLSNYTKANYLRARQLMLNGSYRNAVPCLRAAAYYHPGNDRFGQLARYWLAEAQYKSENYADARKVYTELYNASALDGMDEGRLLSYNIAYSHYRQSDFASAAKWFNVYVDGGDARFREDAQTRLADCLFALRDYRTSAQWYSRVTDEFKPVSLYSRYRAACSYGLLGENAKKADILALSDSCGRETPYYQECMYELGRTMSDLKDGGAADRAFAKLASTATDSIFAARALMGRGMVARNAESYDKALSYYDRVVGMLPGSEFADDALLAIESIYQARKQPEKYLEYLEKHSLVSGRSEEDRENIYFNTAKQVYIAGNWSEAVAQFRNYLEKYPSSARKAECYFFVADAYRQMDNREKSLDWFRSAVETGSQSPYYESSLLYFARLSYGMEQYDDAWSAYSRLKAVAGFEENRNESRMGMMRSAFRGGRFEDAVAAADSVLTMAVSADVRRETEYVKAKSLLKSSRRQEAMDIFSALSRNQSTAEGAEACYIIIQDKYDTGRFEEVEKEVYNFATKGTDQSYWLAKAYVVLGDSFAERQMYEQAKATFESIRDGYQSGGDGDDVIEGVKMRLEKLEILMKNPEQL